LKTNMTSPELTAALERPSGMSDKEWEEWRELGASFFNRNKWEQVSLLKVNKETKDILMFESGLLKSINLRYTNHEILLFQTECPGLLPPNTDTLSILDKSLEVGLISEEQHKECLRVLRISPKEAQEDEVQEEEVDKEEKPMSIMNKLTSLFEKVESQELEIPLWFKIGCFVSLIMSFSIVGGILLALLLKYLWPFLLVINVGFVLLIIGYFAWIGRKAFKAGKGVIAALKQAKFWRWF
jgi:hypothetical protein